MKKPSTKFTMYFQGGYGMVKREVTALDVTVGPYAQYSAAVHVEFIPKGARKVRAFVQSYRPSLLVLEGWDHPEPDSAFLPEGAGQTEGVAVSVGRYTSCDSRWQTDFDAMMNDYVTRTGVKVAHDYRAHDSKS